MLPQNRAIPNIWSLLPSPQTDKALIHKFGHKGIIQLAREEATHAAIDFHEHIGIRLKEACLRYLKNYWSKPFKDIERIHFFTSFKARYAAAMALFDLPQENFRDLSRFLNMDCSIHHTNSIAKSVEGIRITPNVYTSIKDLDRLVEAIETYLKR